MVIKTFVQGFKIFRVSKLSIGQHIPWVQKFQSYNIQLNFQCSRLSGVKIFRCSTFSGGKNFQGSTFSGGQTLQWTTIFMASKFSGGLNFQGLKLFSGKMFKESKLSGITILWGVKFPGRL